jgi:small subunit ribosomal protein S5
MVQQQNSRNQRGRKPQRGTFKKRDAEESGVVIAQALEAWQPKTELGKRIKSKDVTDVDYIFDNGLKVVEAPVFDFLIPNLETDMLMIGQSKGKFGGGARRTFKQTQKKTKEGNKPSFTTYAVVGNKAGYVGMGSGKAKETVPAREKAVRNAKLNMIRVRRGNGSWQSTTSQQNSVPFRVSGKCGSIRLTLIPAPVGTGLIVEKECAKLLRLAGITDVWSRMDGCTATKINVVKACFDALQKLGDVKMSDKQRQSLGIVK